MQRPWPHFVAALGLVAGAFVGALVADAFGFHLLDAAGGVSATVAALSAGLGGGIGLALARRWSAQWIARKAE